MNRISLVLVLAAALTTWAQAATPAVRPAVAPPLNAVQREMQALHELVVTSLVAIEAGKTDIIPAAIHRVHEARGETEKALTSGAWKPPRADATVADFVKTDEAFHAELVKLLRSSKQNDVTATTRQLGAVLEGCSSCHVRFRFPAPPRP